MKLLFWLVKNKKNSKGDIPIYCRITIDGKRTELFTGVYIKENEFDCKKKRIKGSTDIAQSKNRTLEDLSHKLYSYYYKESLISDSRITPQDIKNNYSKKRFVTTYLKDLLHEYRNEHYKMYKDEGKVNLYNRYITIFETCLENLNKEYIKINDCDKYLLDELAFYMVKRLEYSPSYTKKAFAYLRSCFIYALNRRYTRKIIMMNYRVPYRSINEIVYLEEFEVQKIESHTFLPHLQRVADAFLLQCYTGLAYADLAQLDAYHLQQYGDNGKWINITRKKVEGAECTIPVIQKAWSILKKYDFKIPLLTNQKYNEALKKIAKEVGIKKNLTTHVGRKTFGTLLLNKDVPIETVSTLLGHSNIKITQKHYAKVLHMKIAKDIRLVM